MRIATEGTGLQIPEMVTISRASELTGLPYSTLWRKCKEGTIVHIKSRSKYYINLDKLVEQLNNGEIQ